MNAMPAEIHHTAGRHAWGPVQIPAENASAPQSRGCRDFPRDAGTDAVVTACGRKASAGRAGDTNPLLALDCGFKLQYRELPD